MIARDKLPVRTRPELAKLAKFVTEEPRLGILSSGLGDACPNNWKRGRSPRLALWWEIAILNSHEYPSLNQTFVEPQRG